MSSREPLSRRGDETRCRADDAFDLAALDGHHVRQRPATCDAEDRHRALGKRGCFGDWKMKPAVDGDTITWSDVEALAPHATDEDQQVTEVFNSVAWKRAQG